MTSDLESFMSVAFTEADDIIGTVSFTIASITGTFVGVIDRYAKGDGEQQAGGYLPELDAQIVAAIGQFPSEPPPQRDLTIGATTYRIEDVQVDEISYTLGLKLKVR